MSTTDGRIVAHKIGVDRRDLVSVAAFGRVARIAHQPDSFVLSRFIELNEKRVHGDGQRTPAALCRVRRVAIAACRAGTVIRRSAIHIIEPERSTTRQMSRSSCVDVATCCGSNSSTPSTPANSKSTGRAAEPLVRRPVTRTAFGLRSAGCEVEPRRRAGLRRSCRFEYRGSPAAAVRRRLCCGGRLAWRGRVPLSYLATGSAPWRRPGRRRRSRSAAPCAPIASTPRRRQTPP